MKIKEGTSWSEAIECACQPMPNACGIELEAKRRTLSPEAYEKGLGALRRWFFDVKLVATVCLA